MKNPIGDNQEVNIQYKQIQITQKKKKKKHYQKTGGNIETKYT